MLADGRPRRVRVPARALGPLVRDARLSRTPAGSTVIVRDIDDRVPRRPAARRRDPAADRRPRGAAVGDRPGRRRRPDPDRQPRLGRQRRAAAQQRASSPAGSGTTTWRRCRAGCGPSDHAAIVAGMARLRAEPVDGAGRILRLRVLGPARAVRRRWFRLQASAGRGLAPGRGHAHRRHRAGARGAGAGLEGRATTS